MQKCECLRTSRDPRQWCEKSKREAREQEERESAKRLASKLAQNKGCKRRIDKGTSRKKEETRGVAEDRIAMQLAIDESLAAEMEEEGEDDEGTIDVVDNFLTPEHFFCPPWRKMRFNPLSPPIRAPH